MIGRRLHGVPHQIPLRGDGLEAGTQQRETVRRPLGETRSQAATQTHSMAATAASRISRTFPRCLYCGATSFLSPSGIDANSCSSARFTTGILGPRMGQSGIPVQVISTYSAFVSHSVRIHFRHFRYYGSCRGVDPGGLAMLGPLCCEPFRRGF